MRESVKDAGSRVLSTTAGCPVTVRMLFPINPNKQETQIVINNFYY